MAVHGFDDTSYGEAFADVYDDWYQNITDTDATVAALHGLAQSDRPILELGVGTGRIARPLAALGHEVHGVDSSNAMLRRLTAGDADGTVTAYVGDMVDDLPPGPFGLIFVAYNTLFSLRTAERQRRCFERVATRLADGAAFVVEAFVPAPSSGSDVTVRSLTATHVVLSVSTTDAQTQTASGQYIDITEAGGVKLRPWSIRYSTTDELDDMAGHAGLRLDQRFESFSELPFTAESASHVSVYRTIHTPVHDDGPTSQ